MEHDIITRDANNVSWAEIWECSKSQCDIIDAVTISKIIVFEIICSVVYYSVAKFTFPIEQPSKCGIRRSWKLKVKPNLGYCSNIAITISYISVFIHASLDGTYYGMALSVRPSFRPSIRLLARKNIEGPVLFFFKFGVQMCLDVPSINLWLIRSYLI